MGTVRGTDRPMYLRPGLSGMEVGKVVCPERNANWSFVERSSALLHEGAPGHHLQFEVWRRNELGLTLFQRSLGNTAACTEGWALWGEEQAAREILGQAGHAAFTSGYLLRLVRAMADLSFHTGLASQLNGQRETCRDVASCAVLFQKVLQLSSERALSEALRVVSTPAQSLSYVLGLLIYRRYLTAECVGPESIRKVLEIGGLHADGLIHFFSGSRSVHMQEVVLECID